ncbi:RNA 2'-phosphotransferase [Kribbella qitaiheensis]|uniref:RNA 2'-phosphotransferase n=1 Tax=Kribbella qitaiheensis TaxID=1544730 RepID=A0A7G6WX98_9ACTN|nr:tRNA 2'-phosphotransferase [Kribbella qitaiheensis]QNE18613.1 RNA 2'-phosphotransferase [Kribbella qitaiheensis]
MSRESRQLSRLLRHTAGERGLAMTPDGWASIDDVCVLLAMGRVELDRAVEENDKSRLQVHADRIRACQGHSAEGMPVTCEALENSWRRVAPPDLLWHGTNLAALDAILQEGLRAGRRTHVHLAPARNSHVGRRSAVDVLLGIDPGKLGQPVFEAPNGVLLTRFVPAIAIRVVEKADAVHWGGWSGG